MSGLDDFAQGLQQEVVSEIADNYFGARKSLDEMIEALDSWAEGLKKQAELIHRAAGNLHGLLLGERQCRKFYSMIDAATGNMPLGHAVFDFAIMPPVPFAFTGAGRYAKWTFAAYRELAELVNEYLNGKYYVDPEDPHGRKHLTVHYVRFLAMVNFVNEQINQVNERMAPGDTLRYVKGMDPESLEKEKVLDTGMENYQELSNGMRYKSISSGDYGVVGYFPLPEPEKVREDILRYVAEVYRNHREEAVRLMREGRAARRSV